MTAEEILAELRSDPGRCPHIVSRLGGVPDPAASGLLMVVDQLEEVFVECTDDGERRAFFAALHAAATSAPAGPPPAAVVLFGVRADACRRAVRLSGLAAAAPREEMAVGPMDERELREAITGPAHRAGLDVEDGLVELLVRDLAPAAGWQPDGVAHEAGALPLLSHTLRATWDRSRGRRLTVADYRALGGVRGTVVRTADDAVDALPPREREYARQLFVRLVRVGENAPDIRHRVELSELDPLGNGPAPARPGDVLERLVARRLITVDAGTARLTHEAVVTAWPRLRVWIESDRRGLVIAQRLRDSARQWRHEDRDAGLLYRGTRLSAARDWAESGGHRELDRVTAEFLTASIRREGRRHWQLWQAVTRA
jgi:hypothetical protein